jgi:hypothetical protein
LAKQNFINNVSVRGYVFSHTLQERDSTRNPGEKIIMGIVNVATDDDALNVVPVNFFVNEKTKAGKTNATFTNLHQIIAENKTYEECGTNAARVRIQGAIDVNDFYGRDGQLVTGKRVRGSFLHFLNAGEAISSDKVPATSFEADVLLQAAVESESNDGSDYVSLRGFAFNYRGDVLPVTFSVQSEGGKNFFLGEDISAANPYFGKVWGNIKSTVVLSEQEEDSAKTAFGAPQVHETSRTFRTWEVVGANVNEGLGEDTITQAELTQKMGERNARLADLAARTQNQNNTATGRAGFPASAAAPASNAIPAKNDNNYVF